MVRLRAGRTIGRHGRAIAAGVDPLEGGIHPMTDQGWHEEEHWDGSVRAMHYKMVLVAAQLAPLAPSAAGADVPPLELSVWPDDNEDGAWVAVLDVSFGDRGIRFELGKAASPGDAKRLAIRRGAEMLLQAAQNLERATA